MRVVAYCLAEFADITAQAVGVQPLTAPPLTADTFAPRLLGAAQFVYFDMHGTPGAHYWHNEHGEPVLYAQTLRDADLRGAVAFTTACHAGNVSSPMLDALLAAGCAYVIAGAGENYTTARLSGAANLARFFLKATQRGAAPPKALATAKRFYKLSAKEPEQVKADTLQFRIYQRG